jgi:hypothetical protein
MTAVKVTQRSGMAYGIRHDYTPYAPVHMLDFNFKRYERLGPDQKTAYFAEYLSKVEAYKPALAMVPDYFATTPKTVMLAQADAVKAAGARDVMVCPKWHGAVADIPAWCIVAISVPAESYAGFLPQSHEVIGRRLHLLGGQPDQQLYLTRVRYKQAHVISADGNKLALKAAKGQWWSARQADWIQAPHRRYPTIVLKMASAINIVRYLNRLESAIRYGKPVLMCIERPACVPVVQLRLGYDF